MTVDCDIASAHVGDPVFAGAQQVGSVTSAGYGHRVQRNIAYAYVNPDMAPVGTGLRLGMAITVIGVLVAELKFADGGLGYRLGVYYELFRIAPMYAIIVIIFALAAIANVGMTRLQDRANRHMAPTTTKGRKAGASSSGGLGVVATN